MPNRYKHWRLGVTAGSNFGLAVDYGQHWAGRYYLTESSLITGQVNPSIAYRVNRWLSVGAGFSIVGARLFDKAKINNLLPKFPDGGLSLESWTLSAGGNAGILIQPNEKVRFGLTYQSPVDFTFGFNPHTTGLGPGLDAILRRSGAIGAKVNLDMTELQQMMSSVVYQLWPRLALMGDLGWQNWSSFGQTTLGISAKNQRSIAVDMHFSDTWHTAIGEQFRIGEKWLWSAGFAYDSSPVSSANRNPALPLDRQLRYGTGIQYVLNENITVGAANEIVDCGKAPYNVNRGPLAGRLQGGFSNNLWISWPPTWFGSFERLSEAECEAEIQVQKVKKDWISGWRRCASRTAARSPRTIDIRRQLILARARPGSFTIGSALEMLSRNSKGRE